MFCPNCGHDCGGAKFCPECGTPIEVPTQSIPAPQPPDQTPVSVPTSTTKPAKQFGNTCRMCGRSGLFLKLNYDHLCEDCQRKQIQSLQSKILDLQAQIAPERNNIELLKRELTDLKSQKETAQQEVGQLQAEIQEKKALLVETDETVLMQEFGLYKPKYDFERSTDYANRLTEIRQQQKDMITQGSAVTGNINWEVNGSMAQGRKMVKDMQKLLLRAFNSECDGVIQKVKFNNYEASLKRLAASRNAISKLGQQMGISITTQYYRAKINELTLMLEYQQKKQREKELRMEIRAQEREEARVRRELEAERKKAEKERAHYQAALAAVERQIASSSPDQLPDLQDKKAELSEHLNEVDLSLQQIDYRHANQKAGYVYIISNIGSFGENVYKIGMTRRLDPTERVDELGDASVPFKFDIHAMIFSEDAPALEAALHNAFADRRINLVNRRREFFRVTLDEIKAEVEKNFDKTAEFIDIPDAEQYRISEKMRAEHRYA